MKVSYHGHSVIKVETNGTTILIDPFITGNSLTDLTVDDMKPDVIIITHGHGDHLGDTVELAKKHNSLVIGVAELDDFLTSQGVERTHGMSIGGAYQFDFGKVKLTPAFHGTGLMTEKGIIYLGMPAGILFMAEGKTVYHAGDTALFSDMQLIGERHPIDLAFLPIGDNYTMGPEDAALAAEFLQAKQVVPIHFNTFPVIKQDPRKFMDLLKNKNGLILEAGESIEL